MKKKEGLSFGTHGILSFYHQIMATKNAWKNP